MIGRRWIRALFKGGASLQSDTADRKRRWRGDRLSFRKSLLLRELRPQIGSSSSHDDCQAQENDGDWNQWRNSDVGDEDEEDRETSEDSRKVHWVIELAELYFVALFKSSFAYL